jgi:hypothetical protein
MSPKIVFRDISHRDKSLAIAHVGASCRSKRASSNRSARNIQKGGLLSPKTCFRDRSRCDGTRYVDCHRPTRFTPVAHAAGSLPNDNQHLWYSDLGEGLVPGS